ncbi:Aldo-ket-red domain-containing protein [Aphelenchoides besseyi]|nr:Aldo-ket-red domain-containing protein [Aphelenchoides besseyi]
MLFCSNCSILLPTMRRFGLRMASSSNYVSRRPIFGIAIRTMEPPVDSGIDARQLRGQLSSELGGRFENLRMAMLSLTSEEDRFLLARFQALTRWYMIFRRCPTCTSPLRLRISKCAARCIRCERDYYPTLGETLEETVHREVAEEVGIEVQGIRALNLSQPWPMPFSSLMVGFTAIGDPDQSLDISRDELEAAQWFERDEVRAAYEKTQADPMLKEPLRWIRQLQAGKSLDVDPSSLLYIPPKVTEMSLASKAATYTVKLSNGVIQPLIGIGTWQSKDKKEVFDALKTAFDIGYRYIDTAFVSDLVCCTFSLFKAYGNEETIGEFLETYFKDGQLKREDVFLVTKLPFHYHKPDDAAALIQKQLKNLRTDYIDLYLIHNQCSVQKGPDGGFLKDHKGQNVFDNTPHIETWKVMEKFYKEKKLRAIGVSNFRCDQLQKLYDEAEIKPHNLQELAKKYNKTPAQILLRHLIQQKISVIPKSSNPKRVEENFNIFDFEISDEDMKRFDTEINEDVRLFSFSFAKGHPLYPPFEE